MLDIVEAKQNGFSFYDDQIEKTNKLIEIVIDNQVLINFFINEDHYGECDIAIFSLSERIRILLAGKKKSCRINLLDGTVDNVFEHFLFWAFILLDNGLIFEQGELDCLLRDKEGNILDQVPVDPPYEVHYELDGIRFESIVYGTTKLIYPKVIM